MPLCVKGDASKSGSEIDSCARSMEDVNGSKKDLSASAGEACMLTLSRMADTDLEASFNDSSTPAWTMS